jgi:hypothetical protein
MRDCLQGNEGPRFAVCKTDSDILRQVSQEAMGLTCAWSATLSPTKRVAPALSQVAFTPVRYMIRPPLQAYATIVSNNGARDLAQMHAKCQSLLSNMRDWHLHFWRFRDSHCVAVVLDAMRQRQYMNSLCSRYGGAHPGLTLSWPEVLVRSCLA